MRSSEHGMGIVRGTGSFGEFRRNSMLGKSTVLGVALSLALTTTASAGDLLELLRSKCTHDCRCCEYPVTVRPDDHCRKGLPCLSGCQSCHRCNDYCSKGIPCLPCQSVAFRCNDYCRKPMPPFCGIRKLCTRATQSCSDSGRHHSGQACAKELQERP